MIRGLDELIRRLDGANLSRIPVDKQGDVILESLTKTSFPQYETLSDMALDLIAAQVRAQLFTNERGRIPLWSTPAYTIEALVWQDLDTNVHNHDLSGALRILSGDSLAVNFTFDRKGGDADIQWGMLNTVSAKRVGAGDCFTFRPNADFIHKVFHLNFNCVSLRVLATGSERKNQWNYRAGRIALRDPHYKQGVVYDWAPLMETVYDSPGRRFEDMVNWLCEHGFKAEALNFLAYLLAKTDNRDATCDLLARSPHFSDVQKEVILPCLPAMALEMIPRSGPRYGAETELFHFLLSTWGFGAPLHRALKPLLSQPPSPAWVCERLMEMALGQQIEATAAHKLLGQFAAWERALPAPAEVFPLHRSMGWKVDNFFDFLNLCR